MALNTDKKRSIGQASKEIGVQEHVVRYWETQFSDYIKPTIGSGNRRYFFDKDIKVLQFIKHHLHDKGYTIKGLQNLLKTENIDLSDNIKNEEISKTNQNNINNIVQNENFVKNENFNAEIIKNKPIINNNLKQKMMVFRGKLNNFYDKLKSI